MISLGLLTAVPDRFAENRWVRLGIYFGVVLSIEYWLLFLAADPYPGTARSFPWMYLQGVFLSGIAVAAPWLVCLLIICSKRLSTHVQVFAVAVLIIVAVLGFPFAAVLCLLCSTPWAVACYGSAAIWLVRRRRDLHFRCTLAQLLSAITWLAVNFAAWRTAYQLMLAKYVTLPTTPPQDCFVCSAAARGHSIVVRSTSLHCADGRQVVVNDQLRAFKAFEPLILLLSPVVHRAMRRVYNRVGPRFAAALRASAGGGCGLFRFEAAGMVCPARSMVAAGQAHGFDTQALSRMMASRSRLPERTFPRGGIEQRRHRQKLERIRPSRQEGYTRHGQLGPR